MKTLLCIFASLLTAIVFVGCSAQQSSSSSVTDEFIEPPYVIVYGDKHHEQFEYVSRKNIGEMYSILDDTTHEWEQYENWHCDKCEIDYRVVTAPTVISNHEWYEFSDGTTACVLCGCVQ